MGSGGEDVKVLEARADKLRALKRGFDGKRKREEER